MTKEEAKKFGLQLLHGIMERNGSYPVYANNVKQAIEALSEPNGSSEIPNDLEEAANHHICKTVDAVKRRGWELETQDITEAFTAGAKWQRKQLMKELSEKIASAYQLGLADKEKQMMKEAVEGEVVTTNKYTSVRYLSRCGTFRYFYGIGGGFQKGDKVKLIIVKED